MPNVTRKNSLAAQNALELARMQMAYDLRAEAPAQRRAPKEKAGDPFGTPAIRN
jgi:hypothetical protein